MDRNLNKKELKFLQKLGFSADENSSITEIQSLFQRLSVINQNAPANTEVNAVPNLLTASDSVALSSDTVTHSSENIQNIPIVPDDTKSSPNSSVEKPIASEGKENIPNRSAETSIVVPSLLQDEEKLEIECVSPQMKFLTPSLMEQIESRYGNPAKKSSAVPIEKSSDNNNAIDSAKTEIVTSIENSAMVPPSVSTILSDSVQTVTSSDNLPKVQLPENIQQSDNDKAKSWSTIVEEDQSQSCIPKTPKSMVVSDYVEDSEIDQRIQSEKEKLDIYASQIDRLRKQLTIIEHQREISILNLSLFEAALPKANSGSNKPVTKTSAKIDSVKRPKPIQELPSTSAASTSQNNSDVLCFNCSSRGHYSSDCIQPRRPKGSCFKCGSTTHILKNCPSKASARGAQTNRQVASTDSEWSD